MKNKLNFFFFCALIFACLCAPAQSTTDYFETNKHLELFIDAYKQVDELYVEKTTPGGVITEAINAMLKSLDPYTVYYPESKIEDAFYLQTGKYGGIGARISLVNNENTILEVFKGFSADKAGLSAGDIITHIGNKSISGVNLDLLEDGITGAPGSNLTITVKKVGKEDPIVLSIIRESIKTPDVPLAKIISKNIGYIKLDGFTQTASGDVSSAFKNLKSQGAQSLILDLRGNGGGLLMEAVNIVNFFVPKGTVITKTRGKSDAWEQVYSATNEPLDTEIPIVVLIDEGSASASEVVSGALQDLDRAVIIGTNSFGKGLVQQTVDLSYNSKMKITVAKYYTPSGRCIQKLDYGNKKNGEALLTQEHQEATFKTKNGRLVKDGRGIQPDVELTNSKKQSLLMPLEKNFGYFNFGVIYKLQNPTIDSLQHQLTEKEYENFARLTADNAEAIFPELFASFEEVKSDITDFSSTSVQLVLENLKKEISAALFSSLLAEQQTIKPELEKKLVLMYYNKSLSLEFALPRDPAIIQSIETLSSNKYNAILGTGNNQK